MLFITQTDILDQTHSLHTHKHILDCLKCSDKLQINSSCQVSVFTLPEVRAQVAKWQRSTPSAAKQWHMQNLPCFWMNLQISAEQTKTHRTTYTFGHTQCHVETREYSCHHAHLCPQQQKRPRSGSKLRHPVQCVLPAAGGTPDGSPPGIRWRRTSSFHPRTDPVLGMKCKP